MSEAEAGKREAPTKFELVNLNKAVLGPLQQIDPTKLTDNVQANSFESEDEFKALSLYISQNEGGVCIEPPYILKTLDRLSQENNALSPCVEAMVTNIDGTGYRFEAKDKTEIKDTEEEDPKIKQLDEFFSEVWPGKSFITVRKEVRRDVERIGNGYIEVIRNPQDVILFMKHVDGKMMRLVQLGAPVLSEKTLMRGGQKITISVELRERRYAQLLWGKKVIYFKQFGSGRDLNKLTGEWAKPGQRLPAKLRASEIIHFTALPDAHTPYGVPRWISQLPSVLGSRKAEEFNLEFFDNGGVPPVLLLLHGGVLADETRKALEAGTQGLALAKNKIQVIQVEPSAGSLDKASTARITVERFGAERQQDSMFEKYDAQSEQRVRRAFRMPPIFVGLSTDYSFATAFASYTLAESQVFNPERDEFDEIMNISLLPAMGFEDFVMKSNPLTIEDSTVKLKALELAKDADIESESWVDELNEIAGTSFTYEEKEDDDFTDQFGVLAPANTNVPQAPQSAPATVSVSKSEGLTALAIDILQSWHSRDMDALKKNIEIANGLSNIDRATLRKSMASLDFINADIDLAGMSEIMGCAIAVTQREADAQT